MKAEPTLTLQDLRREPTWARWLMLVTIVASCACASIPKGRSAVDAVEVKGAEQVSSSDVEEKLATAPSSKFLGLFQGFIYDYEIFNRYVLERDLQRVERFYRARGYYKARARAGRIFYEGPKHVRVQIVVEEGPPVLIRNITVRGLDALPPKTKAAALEAVRLNMRRGDLLDEEKFIEAEKALRRALTDRGYAYAKVVRTAQVDVPHDFAMLAFDVEPDEPAVFGNLRFEGLADLPEGPVRRAIDIRPGTPYSTTTLEEAQQAALELGVFSSVQIDPDLAEPRPHPRVIPLVVRVQRTKLRTVRLGGGIQLDTIRTDVHGLVGWEHRNLFGGLRSFNVEFRPGVVLYPTRLPTFQAPTRLLPEERLRSEFRQPGFIEARTNAFIRGEFNIYPVLLEWKDQNVERPILGYRELRLGVGVDRTFFRRLFVSPSQNLQTNFPFTYFGDLRGLAPSSLIISYPELLTSLDFRDDRVSPHKGIYLSNTLQVAGVGGDVQDIKVQPEVRGYIPLARRVTLALRASTGLLFPGNYGDPESVGENTQDRVDWTQILLFRAFFSGGANSNRGYPYRSIGPHGVIPYLNPEALECVPGAAGYDADDCNLPLGGFTLWESSIELRFPITGPISGSGFCDASDVARAEVSYQFDPHLSCGPGLRYDTPVGPVRADIGFRIPGAQVLSGNDEGEREPPKLFGLVPASVAIGIGEAF